jgi:UDP-glucose 4-epimerase
LNVVVTGAFGNVGTSVLRELLPRGKHRVRCFDLQTRRNVKRSRVYTGQVEIVWGDIRNPQDVERAIARQDVVIHLAAIIPPQSDANHEVTRAVNIGGTTNILNAIGSRPVRLIYASSLALFGVTQHLPPPRTVSDPIQITDVYTETKAECEKRIRESGVRHTILRFGAVLYIDALNMLSPLMFEVPLTDRIEFVHTYDVGLALANAIERDDIDGKILLIGGGKRCQLYQREIMSKPFEALGIGMLPESAFGSTPFHTDWLDTTESQALLQYQRFTFDDYVQDVLKGLGYRRYFIPPLRPIIRYFLLRGSPYYRKVNAERVVPPRVPR